MNHDTEHSQEYKQALASKHWKSLRAIALSGTGGRCEGCGTHESETSLELHHKTYERLGWELPNDVELLCPGCHKHADAERRCRTIERRAVARRTAAIETYAIKKYGDWIHTILWDELEDEFDEWLERKQDSY